MDQDQSERRASPEPQARALSRRLLLRRGGLVIAAGASGVLLVPLRAAASSKVPKGQAGYQGAPKGDARCEKCAQYLAPSSCKLVDGSVSPLGWCTFFAPKSK